MQTKGKMSRQLTPATIILGLVFVFCLFFSIAVYQIAPQSMVGEFLHKWYGMPVVFLAAYVCTLVAAAILAMLGIPIVHKPDQR